MQGIDFYIKGIPNSKFNMSDVINCISLWEPQKKFYTKHIFYFMDGVEKRRKWKKKDHLANILIFPSHRQFTFPVAIFAPTYLKIIPRALMLGVLEEQESLDV